MKHLLQHMLIYTSIALLAACGSQEGGNADKEMSTAVTNTDSIAPKTVANQAADTAAVRANQSSLLTSLATTYPNGQLPAERAVQAVKDLAQNPAALKLTAGTAPVADTQSTTQISAQSSSTSQPIQAQATAADYQPVQRVQRVQNTTL